MFPFPIACQDASLEATEQWHLGPSAWMPGTHNRSMPKRRVPPAGQKTGNSPRWQATARERLQIGTGTFLYTVMPCCWCSQLRDFTSCLQISQCLCLAHGCCKHVWCKHCCRWNTRETERETYVQHMKPYRLATALKSLPKVPSDVVWWATCCWPVLCSSPSEPTAQESSDRGYNPVFTHHGAYVFLKKTSHFKGRDVGSF